MDVLNFMLTHWPAILCLIAGLGLVIFEMFTPGFHIPGVVGLILLLISVVLSAKTLFQALVMALVILAVLSVVLVFALRSATRGRIYRTALVNKSQEDGFLSVDDMNYFVGREGVAETMLRPAGISDFDGVKLDVVTRGEFVPKGTAVRVIKVEGRRIVVAEVKDKAAQI